MTVWVNTDDAGRWRRTPKSCLRGRAMSDYDRIESAMTYLVDRVTAQPSLEEIAAHVHLSPYHFQRLFWAVGNAIGANPVALLIPCHRVIQQSGALGGYRWGSSKKLMVQAWERMRSV